METTLKNPSKYLGNELEYLKKVLEGNRGRQQAAAGRLDSNRHFQSGLARDMASRSIQARRHFTPHWRRWALGQAMRLLRLH